MVSGTPDAAVSFEFIDADGFREFPGQAEVHCLKDRLDDGWCNAVLPGNRREREWFREIQEKWNHRGSGSYVGMADILLL